ncbi:hypothetical protein [Streptomyces sp. P9-A4]|uniref:hypothetical protein n=1 Tax=Streptomyces sp. P9-A4 TaxID=3072285 RepID=UPI002FC9E2DB
MTEPEGSSFVPVVLAWGDEGAAEAEGFAWSSFPSAVQPMERRTTDALTPRSRILFIEINRLLLITDRKIPP